MEVAIMQTEQINQTKLIRVEVRDVYGVERIYPLDYVNELQVLTKQRTLNVEHVRALQTMGFHCTVIAPRIRVS